MANLENTLKFGDGLTVTAQTPIDARVRVEKLTDLTAEDSWDLSKFPAYKGMIVSVIETGDIYVLLDESNPHELTNWKKQSGGNTVLLTQDEYNAIEEIDENIIYYIYEEDGN